MKSSFFPERSKNTFNGQWTNSVVSRAQKYSVDDYLAIWEQQFGESENELRKRLEDELRIDELRRRNIRSSRSISPKKLREYYHNHPDEFAEDGQISFCQLLIVSNDPDHGKMLTEIDEELADFKTAVQFENVAKKWSMGPRQESGGLYNMTESDLDARFPSGPRGGSLLERGGSIPMVPVSRIQSQDLSGETRGWQSS